MAHDNNGFREIIRIGAQTLLRQGAGLILHFLLIIVVARALGIRGNGEFTIAVMTSTFLASSLNLGIPSAITYYLVKNNLEIGQVLSMLVRIWIVVAVLGTVISFIVANAYSSIIFPDVPFTVIAIAIALFPLILLHALLISILQGAQRFGAYNIGMVLPHMVALLLAVVLIVVFDGGVLHAVVAFGTGYLVANVWNILAIRNSGLQEGVPGTVRFSELIHYGWRSHISNLLMFVNYRSSIYLVSLFLGVNATGIYAVAMQTTERLWIVSQAMVPVLFTRLTALDEYSKQRISVTVFISKYLGIFVTCVGLLLVILAEPLIVLLFGAQYREAADVVLWAVPGVVAFTWARIVSNDIAARGFPQKNIYTALALTIVSIVCSVLLIPELGIIGGALSMSLGYVFSTAVCLYIYKKIAGVTWTAWFVPTHSDWIKIKGIAGANSR